MNHTTIDFETRSCIKLKKRGVAIYAMDESTHALCLAYRTPEGLQQWVWDGSDKPVMPDDLRALIEAGMEFHAFNAPFEKYIWQYVLVEKYGWLPMPDSAWRCTLAMAANANQPQGLDKLGERLKLPQRKLKEGKSLIPLLTEPLKVKKKAQTAQPIFHEWSLDDPQCQQFLEYNKQDVVVEENADKVLPIWNPTEIKVWQMDRRINERGFYIDWELCKQAARIHAVAIQKANAIISDMTEGAVTACTQVARIKKWINIVRGVNFGDTLNETFVTRWLEQNPAADSGVLKILRLRLASNSNTATKYASALTRVCRDSRVRESVRYYGAATGRWTGSGFHPHNFKREAAPDEFWFDLIKYGDYDVLEGMCDPPDVEGVVDLLKQCVRGIITAPIGQSLITSDFAGIEARVLHWLCGNERMLQLFRDDQDIYISAACDIYGVQPEDIAIWNGHKWKIKRNTAKRDRLANRHSLAWVTAWVDQNSLPIFTTKRICSSRRNSPTKP